MSEPDFSDESLWSRVQGESLPQHRLDWMQTYEGPWARILSAEYDEANYVVTVEIRVVVTGEVRRIGQDPHDEVVIVKRGEAGDS